MADSLTDIVTFLVGPNNFWWTSGFQMRSGSWIWNSTGKAISRYTNWGANEPGFERGLYLLLKIEVNVTRPNLPDGEGHLPEKTWRWSSFPAGFAVNAICEAEPLVGKPLTI